MMHKKAYVQDILFFGIIIFILCIMILVGARLNDDIAANYADTDASDYAKSTMSNTSGRFNNIFDWMFLTVFVLFALAIFASVFMIDTHPVFFWIVIILFAVILVVLAIVGNVYEEISTDDAVSTQVSNLSTLPAIMDNWVLILMAIGFIAIILLFSRNR